MGLLDSAQSMLGDISQKVSSVFNNSIDPSALRRAVAGLLPGAGTSLPGVEEVQYIDDWADPSGGTPKEWRVKVSLPTGSPVLYNDGNAIMAPVRGTSGVIFPYTPQIQVSYRANYQPQRLTHNNYAAYFYEGSEVNAIQIQGDFTVQNQAEGRYLFAAIHFFRAASKMFFGKDSGAYQGNPPPILQLNGYGEPYFSGAKCVLTEFSHTMPGDVDYIEVDVSGHTVWLPTTSQISIQLQPVVSRIATHKEFTMEKFVNGSLIGKGFM